MKIKALKAFVIRNASNGNLTSVPCGAVVDMDSTPAAAYISAGLAEAYTLVTPTGTKSITANGENIDVAAYEKANVNVPNPSTGTLDITANADNIDVTAYAAVNVSVPNPSTGKLEITGTAEVNCSAYATAQVVDANLIAENNKKDVNILGVVGTYEGGGVG